MVAIGIFCFNPRTHVGCDQLTRDNALLQQVSIHAPTWGATWTSTSVYKYISVSIHAPTWGATLCCFIGRVGSRVSIHAPTWGATAGQVAPKSFQRFQSTHPRGVRPQRIQNDIAERVFQSTHPRGVRP